MGKKRPRKRKVAAVPSVQRQTPKGRPAPASSMWILSLWRNGWAVATAISVIATILVSYFALSPTIEVEAIGPLKHDDGLAVDFVIKNTGLLPIEVFQSKCSLAEAWVELPSGERHRAVSTNGPKYVYGFIKKFNPPRNLGRTQRTTDVRGCSVKLDGTLKTADLVYFVGLRQKSFWSTPVMQGFKFEASDANADQLVWRQQPYTAPE